MLTSFPLYGARRLARDVERDPIDAGYLVDDAVARAFEEVVWEAGPVPGHRVVLGDGPGHYGVGVGPRVGHYGDGFPKDPEPLCRDVPYDPDRESRPRERLPPDEPLGHPQCGRDDAHLVLEEVPQGLDEVEVHDLGKATHVVVALYPGGVAGTALDDVGVERALYEELGIFELTRLLLT